MSDTRQRHESTPQITDPQTTTPQIGITVSHILMIVTGASSLTMKDWSQHPTGFWAEELVTAHRDLVAAGHAVTIATPGGVTPTVDAGSLDPGVVGSRETADELAAYLAAIADELAPVEPHAATRRAVVDLDAASLAHHEHGSVIGALHRGSSFGADTIDRRRAPSLWSEPRRTLRGGRAGGDVPGDRTSGCRAARSQRRRRHAASARRSAARPPISVART